MGKLKVVAGMIRTWFQGKKTVLGGLVLIAAGVAGAATGQLPVDQAAVVAGVGISICGWSARANRHQAELLSALTAVAVAGAQARAGNKAAAIQTLEKTAAADVVQAATEAKS